MKTIQPRKFILTLLVLAVYPWGSNAGELAQAPANSYFSAINQSIEPNPEPTYKKPVFSKQAVSKLPKYEYGHILGWVPSTTNICQGYYQEPAIILKYPNPGNMSEQETVINADSPSILSQSGTSVLQGNVTVTQLGREAIADKAYINRDGKTGKISSIDMVGNVHMREAGKLTVAQAVHLDVKNNTATVENAVYRFSKEVEVGALNAWGTLAHGFRNSAGVLDLYNATYSTCAPLNATWLVSAKHLHLDKEKGVGTARNTWLKVLNTPVFYLPYFRFPLDERRKTGFLFPTYSYSSNSGTSFSIPFYMNLAPNYDATLTPTYFSARGLQQNVNFRYLTDSSLGAFNLSVLPNDAEFASFKNTAPAQYAGIPNENVFLDALNDSPDTRTYFSFLDNTTFDPHWSSLLNINYVSDDYYFQDFGTNPAETTVDQLLNEADLQYQGENWHFLTRLQGYETLHPINEMLVQNQYNRLPEVDLSGDYPNQAYGLDYQLDSQFVYFNQANNFVTNLPVVTGDRLHLRPGISWPLANMSGYFTPQLQFDYTGYDLKNPNNPGSANGQMPTFDNPSSANRELPMFNLDTGLFFDREFGLFGHEFRQTLEPRLFYLYVPDQNQSDLPEFDTTLPPFSFGQMFQTNRFTGFDRIGDANQVTLALTSRFLDDYTGEEKLSASIGAMYLFQQHHVMCDGTSCLPDPTVNENLSPIVGELSYNLNTNWNATADVAYDPNRFRVDNGSVNMNYSYNKKLFTLGYYFVKDADISNQTINPGETTVQNLSRINVGISYPITSHWSALANWNYNITGNYPQGYFYGAQYDSCCWAMRAIASRNLLALNTSNQTQFDNEYYLQFQLKGLGNFGYNNPSSLLANALPGYVDEFQGTFRPLT